MIAINPQIASAYSFDGDLALVIGTKGVCYINEQGKYA